MIISRLICSPEDGIVHLFPEATIPLYICTTSSLSIPLLIDVYVASMSWLL